MRQAFDKNDEFEWRLAGQKKIKRTVLSIGLKQPIETEQRRQQCRDPEDRRTDPRQQCLIRPHREGRHRHEAQKKHDAHADRAADPTPDAQFTRQEGAERRRTDLLAFRHTGRPSIRSRAATGKGVWGRGEDAAAAGEMLLHQLADYGLRSGIERRQRLVEQPDGPRDRDKPRQSRAAFLPGRQIACGKIGDPCQSETRKRALDAAAAEQGGIEGEIFGERQCRLQCVGMPNIMAKLRPARLRFRRDGDGTRRQRQKAREGAQKRRFPGAIRPFDQKRFAGHQPEVEARENNAPAAFDAESRGFDLHDGAARSLWRAACMARRMVV